MLYVLDHRNDRSCVIDGRVAEQTPLQEGLRDGIHARVRFLHLTERRLRPGQRTDERVRISAIVDACFRLIVDGRTVLPRRRWGSAQELV